MYFLLYFIILIEYHFVYLGAEFNKRCRQIRDLVLADIAYEQGDFVFSREMSSIAPNMGGRILLCDDLSDTGITFNKSIDWLKKYIPIKDTIEDIKTATLWKKKKSTFEPDYCAVKLESNPWICLLYTSDAADE